MRGHGKTWWGLGATLVVAFTILGFFGREVYRKAPPLPEKVVSESGTVLMTRADILDGQQVWQSLGGQQMGSVWGHGAYQAPDWSADWLHRECLALSDTWAQAERGRPYTALSNAEQAIYRDRLTREMRGNTLDASTGTLVLSKERVAAIAKVGSSLPRALRRGSRPAPTARKLCDAGGRSQRRPSARYADRFLLLDQLGLRDRSTG